MRPVLYGPSETAFTSNGIGVLSDCISCLVTEERNGSYELEMEYPSNGMWSEDINTGCIIKAKANDTDPAQLFTVYDVVRTLTGSFTIKAEHISYRLCGVPVKPFSAANPAAALTQLVSKSVFTSGFTFDTDNTSTVSYKIETPRSARSVLGGAEGSLLDVYGGEYHFDNFKVHFLTARGSDNGVTIRYGKNLTELEQEVNGSVYNGIFPFWARDNEGVVYPSSAVPASGTFPVKFYETLDLSDEFDTKPTTSQLTTKAQSLVSGMGKPAETISVSFVTLHNLKEYETISALEHVSLCDTVHVIYDAIGINAKMKVVKTVYNPLTEMYDSIEVGQLQTTLADIVTSETSGASTIGGYSEDTQTVNVANNTNTTLCDTGSLSEGLYLMIGQGKFASNATGRRVIYLTTDPAGNTSTAHDLAVAGSVPVSGSVSRTSVTYFVRVPANTTYYLRAYHNAGSTLSVSGYLRCLKLA